MTITLLVMTDGRVECLIRTLEAAETNLHGPIAHRVIHNDSPDPQFREWLWMRYHDMFDIVSSTGRLGFGGAIRNAWSHLRDAADHDDYVFHLEDDFTIDRPVALEFVTALLDERPELAQIAFRRQPWNTNEIKAGGVVEQHPEAYTEKKSNLGCLYLEQRMFFTTNPSLYRLPLIDKEWPHGPHSEGHFTHRLLEDGYDGIPGEEIRFAFWGPRDGGTWVTHIGEQRAGHGY